MNKIPETIKSRCQYFNFENFSLEQIKQLLTDVAQKEKIAIDEIALNKIAMLANGAARDALSKLDQLASMTNKQITVQDVNEIFGLMNNDQIIDFINHILDADQPY
jgi:DNA polymerase-3 subunit gamma/tau